MDGPLSSSRDGDVDGDSSGNYNSYSNRNERYNTNYHNRHNNYNNNYHNNHNRNNNYYNRRSYRGGRGRGGRHNHYRGRGRHSNHHHRGGRSSGNRFPTSNAASIDPEKAMLKQLSAMVATMGDWSSANTAVTTTETTSDANASFTMDDNEEYKQQMLQLQLEEQTKHRENVLQTITKNVNDLSSVLANPGTAPQFLKFSPPSPSSNHGNANNSSDAKMEITDSQVDFTSTTATPTVVQIDEEKKAGPLATLLIACAYALPLQTASYAALTLAVEKGVSSHETPDYKGFAQRSLQMACVRLHVDLTHMLQLNTNNSKLKATVNSEITLDNSMNNVMNATSPAECFRRCKFILRYLAILVKAGLLHAQHQPDHDSKGSENMGMLDLLQYLSEKHTELSRQPEGAMLAYLILSTIPYLLNANPVDKMQLQSLIDSVQDSIAVYQSPFKPGEGVLAILLKEEPQDGDENDEEEEDSDEDNDEDDTEPCCDSLQELLRTVNSLLQNPDDALFGALADAPWKNSIEADVKITEENPIQPLYLPFVPLPTSDSSNHSKVISLFPPQHQPLSSIVLARLPIYPPPPSEDDDEEDDEDKDDENSANKPQSRYIAHFTLAARTLLHDCIRDILHCHHPTISPSGLERGSCKSVAEQIWSLNILFAPHSIHGIEFGIVECFLGLLAQSHQLSRTASKTATNLTRIYISRVLLELTNLYPTKIPQALAISVASLVEDILPSLVPHSVNVLADWLAFHLINTDFQWPREYWNYWGQEENLKGSKKDFFSRVLEVLASLAGKKVIIENCLPPNSPLLDLLSTKTKEKTISTNSSDDLEKELRDRMWIETELSETLDDWMTEYDDSFEDAKSQDGKYWRAKLVTRAILSPPGLRIVEDEKEEMHNDKDEDMGDDEEGENKEKDDPLQDLLVGLRRYSPLVKSSIINGLASVGAEEDESQRHEAEAAVLVQIQDTLVNNSFVTLFIVEAVHEAVLQHKIVSALGFLKFSTSKTYCQPSTIESNWYHKACLCVKYSVASIITSIAEGVGMVIDSDDSSLRITNVVKQVADNLAPLMEYVTKEVCNLLFIAISENYPTGKKLKLNREMVILIEGLKQTLWEGQAHCCRVLKKYFAEGPGKILLVESDLDGDVRMHVHGILEGTVGGKKLIASFKDTIEEYNDGMEANCVKALVLPWMEKLVF